jgi:hypothetical protein
VEEFDLSESLRLLFRDPVCAAVSAKLLLAGYYRIEPQAIGECGVAALLSHDGTVVCTIAAARDDMKERVDCSLFSVLANGQVLATEAERDALPSPGYVSSVVCQGRAVEDLAEIHLGRVSQAADCRSFTNETVFEYLHESRRRLFEFWVSSGYLVLS